MPCPVIEGCKTIFIAAITLKRVKTGRVNHFRGGDNFQWSARPDQPGMARLISPDASGDDLMKPMRHPKKPKPAPRPATAVAKARARFPAWLPALLLALVTLAVYWPATRHDFVNYDDGFYVLANPHVSSGLTWDNVKYVFLNFDCFNWHPITMLSHMLDCQLFGLNPWGHHLTADCSTPSMPRSFFCCCAA